MSAFAVTLRGAARHVPRRIGPVLCARAMSNAPSDKPYPEYVHLNAFEKAFMTVGSAVMSLVDPYRHGKLGITRHLLPINV